MEKIQSEIDRFLYNIDDSFVLRIWDKEQQLEDDAPILYQDMDSYGDGGPFTSKEDTLAWYNKWVENTKNPPAPPVVPDVID